MVIVMLNVVLLLLFYFNVFIMILFYILIVQVRVEFIGSKIFNYILYFVYLLNGIVEGEFVYINRGYKDDIDYLNCIGVFLKNKIVIVRLIFFWVGIMVLGSCMCFSYMYGISW